MSLTGFAPIRSDKVSNPDNLFKMPPIPGGHFSLQYPSAVEPDKGRKKEQDGGWKALLQGVFNPEVHPDSP